MHFLNFWEADSENWWKKRLIFAHCSESVFWVLMNQAIMQAIQPKAALQSAELLRARIKSDQ